MTNDLFLATALLCLLEILPGKWRGGVLDTSRWFLLEIWHQNQHKSNVCLSKISPVNHGAVNIVPEFPVVLNGQPSSVAFQHHGICALQTQGSFTYLIWPAVCWHNPTAIQSAIVWIEIWAACVCQCSMLAIELWQTAVTVCYLLLLLPASSIDL